MRKSSSHSSVPESISYIQLFRTKRGWLNSRFLIACLFSLLNLTLMWGIGNAKKEYSLSHEIETLQRADLLPNYRTGCYIEQFSSYDRTGLNDDGFSGAHSFLRKEAKDRLVLAEMQGPGVINRIWTPTPSNDTISFYLDGEATPRLTLKFSDLFSGKRYPFLSPLCGNEIGGYFCYLPIPFNQSCKVVLHAEKMRFYQIQYRKLPGYKVESYTGKLLGDVKQEIENVANVWNSVEQNIGNFTMGKSRNYKTEVRIFTLNPGDEMTFFNHQKPGRIIGFEIDDAKGFEHLNRDVMLSAIWDNESVAAIDAPVADFFGYAFGKASMRSFLIGKNTKTNYCYIPFPYDKGAIMKLEYKKRDDAIQNPIQITTRVFYNTQGRDKKTEGKFYSTWRREIHPKDGEYYAFAKLKGKGHYIGSVQLAQGMQPGMTSFFEGDDSTYVDGKMRIHGTGSEDYYNGGWYAIPDCWDRGISLPIHGSLDYNLTFSRTGGYRFYLSDKLPYEKELYMGIEHGGEYNNYPVDYTSVAYYYSEAPTNDESMKAHEHLRSTYMPSEHTFFPELVDVIVDGRVKVQRMRGLGLVASPGGKVRFNLGEIPEGEYELYANYFKKPTGAKFSIWQRQKQITDWASLHSERDELLENVLLGKLYISKQTNTLTFHVSKDGKKGTDVELKLLHLKRIK